MSFQVRKYIYNGHRPVCSRCGAYIPMDEWFFFQQRKRKHATNDNRVKWATPMNYYECICCRFTVTARLRDLINTAYNVYETLKVNEDNMLIYSVAKQIADKVRGL